MHNTNSERVKTINNAWKSNLLIKVQQRIIDDMTPNFMDHRDSSEAEYRHNMFAILKNIKWNEFGNIGIIRWYPKVFTSWHNSVVFLVTTNDWNKYVVKSKNDIDFNCLEIEWEALERRGKEWVKTPRVFWKWFFKWEDGKKYPYLILEYIQKDYEYDLETAEEIFSWIWKKLPLMHKVVGKWFWNIVKISDGEFSWESETYIYPKIINDEILRYILEVSWLSESQYNNLTDWAYTTICEDINKWTQPVWLHRDMWVANILWTRPEITVIDPKLAIWHPMEDIANIMLRFSWHKWATLEEKEPVKNKLLREYERVSWKNLYRDVIDACMISISCFEATTKGFVWGSLWVDFLDNIAHNFRRIYDTYIGKSDRNLLTSPMIWHQREEAQFILDYYPEVFQQIKSLNSWYVDPLCMDILLRSIRKISCDNNKEVCRECKWESCLSTNRISEIIAIEKETIIKNIINWTYNSFSLPWRAYIFQYAIDSLFEENENILFFEIWASAWYIWQVLTNSNFYKSSWVMKESQKLDNRQTFYYWIDFKSVAKWESKKTLVWRSQLASNFRNEIQSFEDLWDKNERMILEEWTLDEMTYYTILEKLLSLKSKFSTENINLVIITSTMKYYFSSEEELNRFEWIIMKLLNEYYSLTNCRAFYLSRELYWVSWKIYPVQEKEVSQFIFKWIKVDNNWSSDIESIYLSKPLI